MFERRQFERIPCYLIARRSRRDRDDEVDFFGMVRNISTGGAMLEADFSIEPGRDMDLAFSGEENETLWEGRGRVIWSRKQGEKYYMGLQFTRPLEEDWHSLLKNAKPAAGNPNCYTEDDDE
jgi:hypothetical protein